MLLVVMVVAASCCSCCCCYCCCSLVAHYAHVHCIHRLCGSQTGRLCVCVWVGDPKRVLSIAAGAEIPLFQLARRVWRKRWYLGTGIRWAQQVLQVAEGHRGRGSTHAQCTCKGLRSLEKPTTKNTRSLIARFWGLIWILNTRAPQRHLWPRFQWDEFGGGEEW